MRGSDPDAALLVAEGFGLKLELSSVEEDLIITEFHTSYGGYLTGCEKSVLLENHPRSSRESIDVAVECFEMGLISKAQTGGMDLSFGNRASALELLHQMARGEGFGRVVGQGVRRMKEIFHKEYGADRAIMEDIGMGG
jgi:hypothetical protein